MNRGELIHLKKELQKELDRREKIKELLELESVQEFIKLANIKYKNLTNIDEYKLILKILQDMKITETNGIYVCTDAFYSIRVPVRGFNDDYERCYVPINSEEALCKTYINIEDKQTVQAWISEQAYDRRIITTVFEKDNIVLNPYNTSKNKNGFEEVRKDFFANAIKYGQSKSKKLLLKKYPRL